MGDISDAGYFLSVLNILSGGPIHNTILFSKNAHYEYNFALQNMFT